MLQEIESKTAYKDAEGDQQRKKNLDTEWSKPSRKHKKESTKFCRDNFCAKGSPSFILPSRLCILVTESYQIKERYPLTEKLLESFESFKFVSHTARMSREFDLRKDLHSKKFECRPQRFVKLSFTVLSNSNLSRLHPFTNMPIIQS